MASLTSTFNEEQTFTQWWLWPLLGLVFLSPFIINYNSIVENGFWGTFSKGISAHIFSIGSIIVLFLLLKLKTQIDQQGIHLHYFPFFRKHFDWKDIKQAEVITYTLWNVGGWGIRSSRKLGTVYNVKGYQGLSIELHSGKKYVIGTQKPSEIQKFIPKEQYSLK